MTIKTQLTNDSKIWFEREHEGKDAEVCLVVVDVGFEDGLPWRSAVLSTAELTHVCVATQTMVVARTGWLPLAENPIVVAAWEKRLVNAEGALEEYRQKSGVADERKAALTKLMRAIEVFEEAKAIGFAPSFDTILKAYHEAKQAGVA